MLGNLRPKFRSKLNNIQLLALTKYSTVAEFGIDRILQPIVEELQKLESVSLSNLDMSIILKTLIFL